MNIRVNESTDHVADAMASFVCDSERELNACATQAAKLVLFDSLAVALGALDHPAALSARRYAKLFPLPSGSLIWGTSLRTTPETATLVNGVPLRGYDYNDLFVGPRSDGHPSDMVPGVLAVAEWNGASGRDVLRALAVGYEVALHLFDTVSVNKGGWDYVNLTSIAGTCAVGSVLGLSKEQLGEALAITVIPHAASNEVESGNLNRRGDLTMWKRFNGGDAIRHSVYACLLASVGVEGAVHAFVGNYGFLNNVNTADDALPRLMERLALRRPLGRIKHVTFKRWPVGSRAQGAIQAALEARKTFQDLGRIREVRVFTQEAVFEHLVRSRKDPWHPFSRETADHSLPYIVAAAVLDGTIRPESFSLEKVQDPARQQFLKKVKVQVSPDLDRQSSGEFLSRIEIESVDGEIANGRALPPPGHPAQPFTEQEMIDKLRENTASVLGEASVKNLIAAIRALDTADNIDGLMLCLAGGVRK